MKLFVASLEAVFLIRDCHKLALLPSMFQDIVLFMKAVKSMNCAEDLFIYN